MITNIDQLDLQKSYSYADYLKWRFEERVELIKGKIFKMSPAPARRHQRISGFFNAKLFNFLDNKACQVYSAPFDVRLTHHINDNTNKIHSVVQPVISVICDHLKLDDHGCLGAPDWIIEILSSENAQFILKNKFELYQENGVKEFWIVDTLRETIYVYVLNEVGKYIGLRPFTLEDQIISRVFPDFQLSVADIFKE